MRSKAYRGFDLMPRNWPRLVLASAVAVVLTAACGWLSAPGAYAEPAAATKKPAKKPVKAAKKAAPKAASEDDDTAQTKRKKQDPAEAAKAIEAAHKMLEAGKAETAVQSLSSTLQAGNLPPGLMARALLYRGMAYRQTQKPALAIADLTQALWLKGGLGDGERVEAQRQRSGAYADAGLNDTGAAVAAATPSPVRTASNNTGVTTGSNPASDAAPPSNTGGGWNLFGGLFGGSSASTPSSSAPPGAPVARAPTPAAVPARPQSSSWSSSTEVHAPSVVAAAPAPPPAPALAPALAPTRATPAPAAVARAPDGRFQLQLALVRTQQEAGAIADRVRGELAPIFATRTASIDQAVVGNFGTMYRVRVGPYASANEGRDACERLKGRGLDCRVVSD